MHCGELLTKGNTSIEKKVYKNLGEIKKIEKEKNKIILIQENGNLVISFYNDNIIRITMLNKKEFKLDSTPAVVQKMIEINPEISEDNNYIFIKNNNVKICISKLNLKMEFFKNNKSIVKDSDTMMWNFDEILFSHEMNEKDKIYGLGEKTGFLDKRGRVYTMWNSDTYDPHNTSVDPLYVSIPFFINFNKERKYGVFFDNSFKTTFDMGEGEKNEYIVSSEGGKLDYYIILGNDIKEIISNYTELTGRTPIPPKWSLGHHQSKYSYRSEEEVIELAENFKKKKIPTDVIHLDIHYMNKYKVFTWDENHFPFPKKMIDKLKNEYGIKIVTIVDPGVKIDSDYDVYKEIMEKDYSCKYLNEKEYIGKVWPGECVFPDFTMRKVREWWGNKIMNFMDEYQISGIWHDMNEPAVFNEKSTMDLEVYHDGDGKGGNHKEYHNLYGFYENKSIYDTIKENKNERPFLLTRAGFSGIQRFAALWTGDNRSMWEHVELSLPMLLNLGMSGVSFAGVDIGGFAGSSYGELLVRWYQLGLFYPFFRNHCGIGELDQEPWAFGDKYEEIIKQCINLRYSLKKEIYNHFYKSYSTGLPLLKPLLMEYSDDENTYDVFDQFIFGENIMVAPIIRPGVNKRLVYFPQDNWYGYFDNEKHNNYEMCDCPLEKSLIFIKGGSIITNNQISNNFDSIPTEYLDFIIILDEKINENKYINYDDDGKTFDYEKNIFYKEEISYIKNKTSVKIAKTVINNNLKNKYKKYKFHIKNISDIKSITTDNINTSYQIKNNILEFSVNSKFKNIEIIIKK